MKLKHSRKRNGVGKGTTGIKKNLTIVGWRLDAVFFSFKTKITVTKKKYRKNIKYNLSTIYATEIKINECNKYKINLNYITKILPQKNFKKRKKFPNLKKNP